MRAHFHAGVLTLLAATACQGPPFVPTNPTWADVEPILRAECNHCHGSTAETTGSIGAQIYRFDFFDMTATTCGDAALALNLRSMAGGWANLIKTDLTKPPGAPRPRMPPAPAQTLPDWALETINRWANNPSKGAPPTDNFEPNLVALRLPNLINRDLSFTAVVRDPNGESVVGVIRFAGLLYKMDSAGSFAVRFDTGSVAAGTHRVTATLCDGWGATNVDLGPVEVRH